MCHNSHTPSGFHSTCTHIHIWKSAFPKHNLVTCHYSSIARPFYLMALIAFWKSALQIHVLNIILIRTTMLRTILLITVNQTRLYLSRTKVGQKSGKFWLHIWCWRVKIICFINIYYPVLYISSTAVMWQVAPPPGFLVTNGLPPHCQQHRRIICTIYYALHNTLCEYKYRMWTYRCYASQPSTG